ncbi:MAG: MATE family efflux transporter, partial [Proteobacteria bacterium]|nr:MATE family efflux transporter [Pseudomonadota bacterium]
AGLATALCSWVTLWAILWGVGGAGGGLELGGKSWVWARVLWRGAKGLLGRGPPPCRASWASAKRILKLGIPIGLQATSESIVFTFVGVIAASMSEAASAAHNATMAWMGFSFCFALGLGGAASVRMGWAIGQEAWGALRRTGAVAMVSSLSLMAPWAILYSMFPRLPAGHTTHSAEALALAIPLFVIGGFFQLMDGLSAVVSGLLRGAGDTQPAFYITTLGYYGIGAPLGLYLAYIEGLGVRGLWWGLAVGVMVIGPTLALRFYWRISKPLARA